MSDTTATQSHSHTQHEVSTTEGRLLGRVSWFNQRKGYGFIHHCGEDGQESDVYVHFSGICQTDESRRRNLFTGEYVEYRLEEVEHTEGEENTHTHKAVEVTGPNRFPLLYETRQTRRFRRHPQSESSETTTERRSGRGRGRERGRGRGRGRGSSTTSETTQ